MLHSAKHEILNAHKYKNIKNISILGWYKPRMLVLTFMSRGNFYAQLIENYIFYNLGARHNWLKYPRQSLINEYLYI